MQKVKALKKTVIEASDSDGNDAQENWAQIANQKKQGANKNAQPAKKGKAPPSEEDSDELPVAKNTAKPQAKFGGPAKAQVSAPKTKQVAPPSSDDDSSQEQAAPAKKVKQQSPAQKPAKSPIQKPAQPPKKVAVQQQDSSDSEESTPVIKTKGKVAAKPVPAPVKSPQVVPKSPQAVAKSPLVAAKSVPKTKPVPMESESDDSSPPLVAPKKAAPVNKSPALKAKPAPVPAKKAPVEESASSDESEVVPPPKGKKAATIPAPVAKKAAKVPEPESDDEDDSSEPAKPVVQSKKAQPQAVPAKKVVKVVQKSDSEEEEEEAPPAPKARKASIGSESGKGNKNAVPAKKQAAKKEEAEDDEEGEFEVCVLGLSFNAYENDIREFFQDCGEIHHFKLLTRPDGKSKGIAFVKFGRKSHMDKALELNGSQLMDRQIKVEKSQPKGQKENNWGNNEGGRGRFGNNNGGDRQGGQGGRGSDRPRPTVDNVTNPTLYVGGLNYDSTRESIYEHFSHVGSVQNIRVITDKETGKPRGFAYVQFSSVEDARKAFTSMNGSELEGRRLRLDGAPQRDRPEGGFGGGGRGGFGGGGRGGRVNLDDDERNARKGVISSNTAQGKVTYL